MSNETQPSMWQRSSIGRFFRWLVSWRILRRLLIACAWIITLVALLYGAENWRGKRAWNTYREQLESRGEQLHFQAFIPKPIPDDQNFAATPFFEYLFAAKGRMPVWQDRFLDAQALVHKVGKEGTGRRRLTDLFLWQQAFAAVEAGEKELKRPPEPNAGDGPSRATAAAAVLEALKPDEPLWEELRAASRRPQARYPIVYKMEDPWGILLPHLGPIRGLAARLRLKACAELAAGRSDAAWQDMQLLLRLTDSLRDEPTTVSYLARCVCLHFMIQPLWEGLSERRWSDAQLAAVQTSLQSYDMVGGLDLPLHAERAAGVLTAELLYQQKYRLSYLFEYEDKDSRPSFLSDLLGRLAPRGWYYQEQLNYCRLYETLLGNGYDSAAHRIFPERVEEGDRTLKKEFASGRMGKTFRAMFNHHLLAAMMLPSLNRITVKAATAQTAVDQAMIAAGLERYRLAQGEVPETLAALVPKFLAQMPRDVISGEPYQYQRLANDRFTLYGVGWNSHDDQGTSDRDGFGSRNGDWVWEYTSSASLNWSR